MKLYIIKEKKIPSQLDRHIRLLASQIIPEKFNEVYITFTSNRKIKEINRKIFKKNSNTDVITLTYNNNPAQIMGEIFISVEQAELNSKRFNLFLSSELLILVTHSFLHLKGFDDKSHFERKKMNLITLRNLKKLL